MTYFPKSETTTKRPYGLGGSDIAAVLGLSPYKTPLELWFDLVGRTTQESRDLLHLRFGQHAESFIAEEYERRTGFKTHADQGTVFHSEHDFMFGHIDRFVIDGSTAKTQGNSSVRPSRILECKTASVFNRSEWGDDGTSEVPAAYLLQCVWYMAMTDCEDADLAALIGNSDFRVYNFKRDLELESLVLEHAKTFWTKHVLAKCPPPPSSTSDLQLLYPKEVVNSRAEANPVVMQTLRDYAEKSESVRSASAECEKLKAEILAFMGEAEQLTFLGKTVATWKCTKPSKRIDTKALSNEHPEIAEKFLQTVLGSRRFLVR